MPRMPIMDTSNSPSARPKPQSRACEACRAAKIRCQASPHPGICKRCSDFKRECIFRTGPRTRRTKVAIGEAELPPPPGPSKTFSIEFSMPADEDPEASFEELRQKHERFLDDLVPSSEEESEEYSAMPPTDGSVFNFANLPSPPSTAGSGTRPMLNLGIKPQFNLDSAEKLLQTFRQMLPSCPCIVLEENCTVRTLARDSPFVLLAVLAATSCSTSLQGHSLYDEEFRKVLGLKFVTGGERSLDLLQGILIYCAWYPFHLRPKHRQAFQYLKMATDIVHDLELDQEEVFADRLETGLSLEDYAGFRAFISCYYLITTFTNSFSRVSSFPYTTWLAKCCDILEQHSNIEQDQVLAWLVRLHHISDEMLAVQKSYKIPGSHSEHHRQLIKKGLETQLREWQSRIPTTIALMPSVMMSSLFDDMHLLAAPLMNTVRPKKDKDGPLDANRLMDTVHTLRAFFEFVVALPPDEMGRFSGADSVHLIAVCILAYRLSLPIDVCPGFDFLQARKIFDFSVYLEKLCKDPEGDTATTGRKTDVCAAFRVVLRSLKTKVDKKVAAAIEKEEIKKMARECPMFDGSIDDYVSLWDGHGVPLESSSYPTSQSSSSGFMPNTVAEFSPAADQAKPLIFPDLWATMTLGWGTDDPTNFGLDTSHMDIGSF